MFFVCLLKGPSAAKPGQARPGQARVHARSSADKTFPLVDSSTATCHGRWCDIQPLSTGQGGKQRQAQEDIRGSDGGEEGAESGENRSVRNTREAVDVEPQRHHVDRGPSLQGAAAAAAAAETCRQEERDMASIFHTVNKMSFAVQGKYTASHSNFSKIHTYMHSHTLITKSLQSSTWQRHTNRIFFFSPPSLLFSSRTKQHPCLSQKPFYLCLNVKMKTQIPQNVT